MFLCNLPDMNKIKADTAFNSLVSLCLQGRCKEGLAIARKIPSTQLPPKKRRMVREFIQRFSAKNRSLKQVNDPIRKLILIYEEYWHQILLNSEKQAYFEKKLFRSIAVWMKNTRGVKLKSSSREKIINRLKKEVEALGYFCITGTVAPFQELEIWRTQKKVVYSVKLPEATQKVTTVLMSDFITKGWVSYATMGFHYPGGWAKRDALYCNTHAYNLKSEKFRVSYLGHEAQHYLDYKKFPRLGQADLEYRAKLAEFALSKKTAKKMYQVFASRADYNRRSPHAFSYFCVVRDLAKIMKNQEDFGLLVANLPSLRVSEINNAARLLMRQHSDALKAKGAKTVKSLIV